MIKIGFFYVAQPSSYDVERTPDIKWTIPGSRFAGSGNAFNTDDNLLR
jgi:hypothetical protein